MSKTINIKIKRNKQNGGFWADFIKGDKKYYADLCYSIFTGSECMIFEYKKDDSIDWRGVYCKRGIFPSEKNLLDCINEFIEEDEND